jgi:hypothetical protein
MQREYGNSALARNSKQSGKHGKHEPGNGPKPKPSREEESAGRWALALAMVGKMDGSFIRRAVI